MAAYELIDHEYDVVVVGAGGSGLRAALGAAQSAVTIAQTAAVAEATPWWPAPVSRRRT